MSWRDGSSSTTSNFDCTVMSSTVLSLLELLPTASTMTSDQHVRTAQGAGEPDGSFRQRFNLHRADQPVGAVVTTTTNPLTTSTVPTQVHMFVRSCRRIELATRMTTYPSALNG